MRFVFCLSLSLYRNFSHLNLRSFPTRRSSDLNEMSAHDLAELAQYTLHHYPDLLDMTRLPEFDIQGKTFDNSNWMRSEEHTSELQSRGHLVCRLLLEKKNKLLM